MGSVAGTDIQLASGRQEGNKESLKGFVGKGFASEEMRGQAELVITNSDCWLKAMEIFGYKV